MLRTGPDSATDRAVSVQLRKIYSDAPKRQSTTLSAQGKRSHPAGSHRSVEAPHSRSHKREQRTYSGVHVPNVSSCLPPPCIDRPSPGRIDGARPSSRIRHVTWARQANSIERWCRFGVIGALFWPSGQVFAQGAVVCMLAMPGLGNWRCGDSVGREAVVAGWKVDT